jgi:branched-chain amino acid transport system substrate-binding protein
MKTILACALALVLPGVAAAASYDINVVLPVTGPGSFLGSAEKTAIELVEKQVNASGGIGGTDVHFVFHDDQSSPQETVQLTSGLLAQHPAVLMGSSLVAQCNAIAPLMTQGPVEYCFSPGIHPDAGSYIFTSSVSTFDLARALIAYYRGKGWTRIAIITSSDATGQDADKGLAEILADPANKAMEVVAHPHFNPTDVSVAAQMGTIAAAKPQAIIAWSTGAPIATIFKGLTQAGIDVPTGTTDGNMTLAQMERYASFLPKQLYFPSAQWVALGGPAVTDPDVRKAQEVFAAAYKDAGKKPDVAAALAWDPAQVLVAGLRALGTKATASEMRAWLASHKGAGVDGVYDFAKLPQRGLDASSAIVSLWDAKIGYWTPVSSPGGAPLP